MEQSTLSGSAALDRAMKPFALPLGLASPMWMAYGAAASAGAAWWWMSRMNRFLAPHHAEAAAAATCVPEAGTAPLTLTAQPVQVMEEVVTPPLEAVAELVAPLQEEPEAVEASAEPAFEQPDELTLLRGVGPRVADALVARGVTTFAQLAAWSEHDMAHFDKELKLLHRSTRYDFLGQARKLAGV